MSLRVRLAAVVAITFAVVVVGCVFAARQSAGNELRAETDRFLEQRAREPRIQRGTSDGGGRGGPHGPREPPPFADPDAQVQFIDADGNVLGSPAAVALPIDDGDKALADAAGPNRLRTVTVDGVDYRMLTVHVPGGAAQLARSVEGTSDVLSSLDLRLLFIALGGTVLAALLAWLIARNIVRPVERLTAATENVARTQDLESTIDVNRRDELGRLASSFNAMLGALRTSRAQQQRLVMDASHELRTPLTALRTNIEVLQRASTIDDAQRAQILGEVEVELTELTDLVAELVDLATDTRAEEPPQRADLAELAAGVVERMRRRTGRDVTLTINASAEHEIRAGAIERALANLIDNGCKFSTSPAPVDVTVDHNRIDVSDRGPGVAADDRARVFDRFYRAADARTMPGSGLGLSIVQQVVEVHGGTVELLPREGGGTTARVTFPD